MIIKSKDILKTLVFSNLQKYPIIKGSFQKVIFNLLKNNSLSELLEIPLIRYLATKDKPIENFEEYLNKKTFTNLNVPILRLKSDFKHQYYAVLAELETAWRLNREGKTDIKFITQQGKPDIEYKDKGITKYAEVKNLLEINPEFTILHDKLEAESLRNRNFQVNFLMDCNYDLQDHENISNLHKDIEIATTLLVRALREKLRQEEVVDETFTFNQISFNISAKKERIGFFFAYHGSGGLIHPSAKDAFISLSSVYTRMISNFRKGYIQLLKNRLNDKLSVEQDRVYLYLNLGRGYNAFIGKETEKIFKKFAKATAMADLADLKIIL